MNRGVLQSSPVQQIMAAGNPNWWPMAAARPPSHHHHPNSPLLPTHHSNNFNFVQPQTHHSSSPFPFPFSSPSNWPLINCTLNDNATPPQHDQITPDSWSHQFFMSGLVGEEERAWMMNHQALAMEQLVKQENYNPSCHGFVYGNNEDFQQSAKPNNNNNNNNNNSCWSPQNNKFMATNSTTTTTTSATNTSSPQSCVTTTFTSTNLLELSSATAAPKSMADPTSECNSTAVNNGGAFKKAKVQTSATQSTFKVRKFGDRIAALHQLVSPFGKTDTASVLLEAIGYLRFLQKQIEALSLPYLSSGSGNNKRQQHPPSGQGERKCIFPEDPGQLLNDNCLKRKGGPDQEEPKDLRSRGLCLVPVSCTLNVGRDNGADYWAPALGGFP